MTASSNEADPSAPVYAWVSDVIPAPVAMRIRDVSPTGLLLSFDGVPAEVDRAWFSAGAIVGLALPVMTASGLVSVAVRAQIKGVFPAAMAVKLTQPDERLLAAVRHLLSAGPQAPLPAAAPAGVAPAAPRVSTAAPPAVETMPDRPAPPARARTPTATRDAACAECRGVLQRHTATLISTFLRRAASVLGQAAAAAAQPALQRQIEAVLAAVHGGRAAIGNRIEENLRHALDARFALAAAGSTLPEIELPAELTLVATRELRDSIAWADSVSRIQTQLRSKSYEAERRVADLLKHEVDQDADPLGVAHLCAALREAVIAEAPAAEGHQRYLAEALEGEVAGRMASLYDDLNDALKKHGAQAKPARGRSNT